MTEISLIVTLNNQFTHSLTLLMYIMLTYSISHGGPLFRPRHNPKTVNGKLKYILCVSECREYQNEDSSYHLHLGDTLLLLIWKSFNFNNGVRSYTHLVQGHERVYFVKEH